jgi:hypothetical protein
MKLEKTFLSRQMYIQMLEHNVYNRNYVKQHFVACALTRKENELRFGRTLFEAKCAMTLVMTPLYIKLDFMLVLGCTLMRMLLILVLISITLG